MPHQHGTSPRPDASPPTCSPVKIKQAARGPSRQRWPPAVSGTADSVLPNDWPGHTCRLEPSLSMYHWCPTSVTKGHRDYKSCAPIAKCHDLYTCYKGCGASKSARDALTVTWEHSIPENHVLAKVDECEPGIYPGFFSEQHRDLIEVKFQNFPDFSELYVELVSAYRKQYRQ
ncbi:hypothetical protein MCOR07_004768 [Pyricularia oryzae]|nr:hypothetical protein MCOR07_004768 [Pyricularia oryzae]